MQNPSLRETPSHEPADVIPSKQQVSLLDWLTQTGRLIPRDNQETVSNYKPDEEEISELIVDDASYAEEEENEDEDLVES